MKKIKSIIAVILAALMILGTFSICAFADNPKITDIKWNDDYSVEFNFNGAEKYIWDVYINGSMIWGFGTTSDTKITREKMLPYLTALAEHAISEYGYSGNVSFDFVIYAKNSAGTNISAQTKVSKVLNLENVAAGKLAPDSEIWQYYPVSTTDEIKLRNAVYGAYDPDQAMIQSLLSSTGVTYHQYINAIIDNARKDIYYTFTGTLAQVLRFGSFYSSYAYTDVTLAPKYKVVKEVNITIVPPKAGKKVEAYMKGSNISCDTPGVTVNSYFNSYKAYEITTKTSQKKFYSGNEYQMGFVISYDDGYVPDSNVIVKVNGVKADYMGTDEGLYGSFFGYYGYTEMTANGNFFRNILTFFHNIFTKLFHPSK